MKTKPVFGSNVTYIAIVVALAALAAILSPLTPSITLNAQNDLWTSSFNLEDCKFSTKGSNPYFILQPGYQLVFVGIEDGEPLNVTVFVSNETKIVGDGIVTRVVEERVVNSETGDLRDLSFV